ncbi:MAG: nucleotidyltransferase [Euryarchaeota archaeon]|nr:nucleotidyltransferase [Euryarchaeota archaeon]
MSGGLVSDDEQREVLRLLAREFHTDGLHLLVLGSTARLFKTGHHGATKDMDLHPFPVGDVENYLAVIERVAAALHGHYRIEPDGASISLYVPTPNGDVPVELIEGREDFISPEVLKDAVMTAGKADDIYVPSWEHLVAMKAEAMFDRVGAQKARFSEDLLQMAKTLSASGEMLGRGEVNRIVALRPERKRDAMRLALERIFALNMKP